MGGTNETVILMMVARNQTCAQHDMPTPLFRSIVVSIICLCRITVRSKVFMLLGLPLFLPVSPLQHDFLSMSLSIVSSK